MSVNVDFELKVRGFGTNKRAVVKSMTELLHKECLEELVKKETKDELRFVSDIPIIISQSYVYLPALGKRLGKAAKKAGVTIELRVKIDRSPWMVVKTAAARRRAPKQRPKQRTKRKTAKRR